MKKRKFTLFILTLILSLEFNLVAQNATFTDHGFIPVDSISAGSTGAAEFHTAFYYNGDVFIATSDGIWKNNMNTQVWSPSGLQGKRIISLYQHPSIPNKFFAGANVGGPNPDPGISPLYISTDGGITWNPAAKPVDEPYFSIAVSPNNPNHIFANTCGIIIAVSVDGGDNWVYMNNGHGGYMGYQSNLIFTPNNSNQIYQGSENPLDCAWLGRYDVNQNNPVIITNLTKVVEGQFGGGPWENRRPNKLQTYSYTGSAIYVGHEGALSKVNPNGFNQSKFIYQSNSNEKADKPYSYIYGIWVDPLDTNHIIFGGGLNNTVQPMQLYETFNEGLTFHRYTQTFGLNNPRVCDIVDIGNNKVAVILNDQHANRVKLVVMQPITSSIENPDPNNDRIDIFPNPTSGAINIKYYCDNIQKIKIQIFNPIGENVFEIEAKSSIQSIQLNNLSKGEYLMSFNINGKSTIKKVILK